MELPWLGFAVELDPSQPQDVHFYQLKEWAQRVSAARAAALCSRAGLVPHHLGDGTRRRPCRFTQQGEWTSELLRVPE